MSQALDVEAYRLLLRQLGEAQDKIERLEEDLHYNKGCCELAMKHRDEAEAKIKRLEAALKELRGVALHNDVLHPPSVVKFIDAALAGKEE